MSPTRTAPNRTNSSTLAETASRVGPVTKRVKPSSSTLHALTGTLGCSHAATHLSPTCAIGEITRDPPLASLSSASWTLDLLCPETTRFEPASKTCAGASPQPAQVFDAGSNLVVSG